MKLAVLLACLGSAFIIIPLFIVYSFPTLLLVLDPTIAGAVVAASIGAGMVLLSQGVNMYRDETQAKRKFLEKRLEKVYVPINSIIERWADWSERFEIDEKQKRSMSFPEILIEFYPTERFMHETEVINHIVIEYSHLIPEDALECWNRFLDGFRTYYTPDTHPIEEPWRLRKFVSNKEEAAKLEDFCRIIREEHANLTKKYRQYE